MGELFLTVAEIARRLDLPESSVRFYRNRFESWIPTLGKGRSRRYRPEAVEILRVISDLMRAGQSVEAVEAELRRRFPMDATAITQTAAAGTEAAAVGPQDAALLALLTDQVRDAVRDEVERIVRDEVSGLMAEVTTLREEVTRLTRLLSAGQQQDPQPPAAPIEASEPPAVDQVSQPAPARPSRWDRFRAWLAGE